jgi:hypothetical protein
MINPIPTMCLMPAQHLVEKLCADDKVLETECEEIKTFIIDSFFEHGRKNSGSCFRQPLLYVCNLWTAEG